MNLYKVHVNDKSVFLAEQLDMSHPGTIKLEINYGRKTLKWLTIYADSENESLVIAEKIIKDFPLLLQ